MKGKRGGEGKPLLPALRRGKGKRLRKHEKNGTVIPGVQSRWGPKRDTAQAQVPEKRKTNSKKKHSGNLGKETSQPKKEKHETVNRGKKGKQRGSAKSVKKLRSKRGKQKGKKNYSLGPNKGKGKFGGKKSIKKDRDITEKRNRLSIWARGEGGNLKGDSECAEQALWPQSHWGKRQPPSPNKEPDKKRPQHGFGGQVPT